MINTIIIPDVHGRKFWKDAIPYIKQGIPTIFLGDYLDPYPFESVTGWHDRDVVENFKEIIEVAKNHHNVTLLLGNHDLEYWDDRFPSCRYMENCAEEIKVIFEDNKELFKLAHICNDIVYSHAGISDNWLEFIDLDKCLDHGVIYYINARFAEKDEKILKSLMMISWSRGGHDLTPSMVWSDISDWKFLKSFTNKKQIVGHTLQLKKQPTIDGFIWVYGDMVIQPSRYKDCGNVICVDTGCVWCIEDDELKKLSEIG